MRHEEHDIQVECVRWFRAKFPAGLMFSVPNGGKRTYAQTVYFMAEGMSKGSPDTIVVLPNKIILFVEFKTPRGRQSNEQVEFQDKCDAIDKDLYWVIRDVEDFKCLIEHFSELKGN